MARVLLGPPIFRLTVKPYLTAMKSSPSSEFPDPDGRDGAGVIGIEYAIMFATLGVEVTVVDGRPILRFLRYRDRRFPAVQCSHVEYEVSAGRNVSTVIRRSDGQVAVKLESQKHLVAETALFSVGREGAADTLNLTAANLSCDQRGRLSVNKSFQTETPNIHAVGDIIGFPSLASSAMEQGRRAALHAFGQSVSPLGDLPYGLFTIPEISMIGRNEQELTAKKVPYEVGLARYGEIARGQIIGDEMGMLKILFHRETLEILGVHCIGDLATEIVHIGQAVMSLGGKINYFCETVFNYPTMAECYRVAAFNGLNRLNPEHDLKPEIKAENLVATPLIPVDSHDLQANVTPLFITNGDQHSDGGPAGIGLALAAGLATIRTDSDLGLSGKRKVPKQAQNTRSLSASTQKGTGSMR